jgi:hypothetical protein
METTSQKLITKDEKHEGGEVFSLVNGEWKRLSIGYGGGDLKEEFKKFIVQSSIVENYQCKICSKQYKALDRKTKHEEQCTLDFLRCEYLALIINNETYSQYRDANTPTTPTQMENKLLYYYLKNQNQQNNLPKFDLVLDTLYKIVIENKDFTSLSDHHIILAIIKVRDDLFLEQLKAIKYQRF